MATYSYKARTKEGATTNGLVEAGSHNEAARLLRDKGLFVIVVKEASNQFTLASLTARFKKINFSDVVNFTRQLSTMIVAGLSLPEALTILRQQTTNEAFAGVLMDVEHQIVGGGNLADSLSRYPDYFSSIYVALVRAGESSGNMDKVLIRLSESLEAQMEFEAKVKGAMIYPIIILIGMGGVVFIMMTVVVPKLTDLYKDFNIDLPFTTKLLMSVSSVFVHFWWLMLLVIFFGSIGFAKWKKTKMGEYILDKLILKIPLFGELQKKIILVEFTRTLAMLISSGIHILDGLHTLRDSLNNIYFREAIDDISEKVEKGLPLGDSFSQHDVFPAIVSQMMKVGEETGKLDDTLSKLADYFQSESEHLVKGLTTAIEPLIMVVLGVGVGFIVISVITPIYNLTSQFK